MDTSSIARKLAHEGKGAHGRNVTNAVLALSATKETDSDRKPSAIKTTYNPELLTVCIVPGLRNNSGSMGWRRMGRHC